MTSSGIAVAGLTKYYGPVVGVEDLSFEVARGEVFGFLGANGAGKTTTIRLLLDLLRPSRGRASVLGIDCHGDSLRARAQIGYLPAELPIYPDLSAMSYLEYLARIDGRPVAPDYLQHLLRRFDVSAVDARRRLRDQSHGMRQKIGIIQALMTRAPVIVLDEPTTGLDPLMAQAFRETIGDLKTRGDVTVFLSSHVLTDVETTCDRVGLIRGGRLVATAAIDELKRTAARRVSVSFSAPVTVLPPAGVSVRERTDTRWELDVRGPIGELVERLCGLPVADLQVESFTLEQYVARFYGDAPR